MTLVAGTSEMLFLMFFIWATLNNQVQNEWPEPFLIGSTLLALIAVISLFLSMGMLHKNWAT